MADVVVRLTAELRGDEVKQAAALVLGWGCVVWGMARASAAMEFGSCVVCHPWRACWQATWQMTGVPKCSGLWAWLCAGRVEITSCTLTRAQTSPA